MPLLLDVFDGDRKKMAGFPETQIPVVTSTSEDENLKEFNSDGIVVDCDRILVHLLRIKDAIKSLERRVPQEGRSKRYKNLANETKTTFHFWNQRLQEQEKSLAQSQ